jgi:hypothetical protein
MAVSVFRKRSLLLREITSLEINLSPRSASGARKKAPMIPTGDLCHFKMVNLSLLSFLMVF